MSASTQVLRIFVVENDADTLKYLRLFLESMGHVVFAAGSLADALALIPQSQCDVLISDIGLEDGTGWDLLEQLHRQAVAPPFTIAVSGFGRTADQRRSLAVGYRHHILKPYDLDEIEGLLHAAQREQAA